MVKFIGKGNCNWRRMGILFVLAGTAFAQTTPPPTPPTAPTAPAVQDEDSAREAERARRSADRERQAEQRSAERAKAAEQRAKSAEDRARRVSTARVYMFGDGSYLGVDVQDVTKDRLSALKLKEERGAEVTMVDQDGPAGKAGLKEGDVILSFNGEKVESAETLKRMIHETPAGRSVALGVSRNGQSMNLNTQLADRRELGGSYRTMVSPHVVIPPMPPMPPMHMEMPNIQVFTSSSTPRVGISIEPLTPQLGDYFGAPNGQGLLIRSVEKGSPADQAGLKAGDVIVRVGGERIADSGDWRMVIRDKTGSVPFTIMRDKREQTVNVKVPERRSANNEYFKWDSQEFAANMKDFEKNMKDWQKDFENNSKEWGKELEKFKDYKFDFRYDDGDGSIVIIPNKDKSKDKDKDKNKSFEKQQLKNPSTTVILKDKSAA